MEPTEIQARATIAAALIVSRAVEVPTIPTSGDWSQDTAALRLRDLTDYVYQRLRARRVADSLVVRCHSRDLSHLQSHIRERFDAES